MLNKFKSVFYTAENKTSHIHGRVDKLGKKAFEILVLNAFILQFFTKYDIIKT